MKRMEDMDLDRAFEKIKNTLPVNHDLKRELRKNFIKKRKPSLWKKLAATAAAVAVISSAVFWTNYDPVERVSAAELNIQNHISFVDIGSSQPLHVSEHNGKLYMPVFGEGIFIYDGKGFTKINDEDTYYLRVSPDGKQLVFSSDGVLKTLDMASGKVNEILKGDGAEIYYEEPSWVDDHTILYVKKEIQFNDTHGFTVKESGIYSLDLNTMNSVKLTDGEHPSHVNGMNSVVFSRDGKVMFLNLKSKSEEVVDDGRFPSVSPDGKYIAYVKTETSSKEVAKNARIDEAIEDIWIADTTDFSVKKKLTANYPHYFISADEWAVSLEPSDVPQVLEIPGTYSYYEPTWSSDSKSIYAVKSSSAQESGEAGNRVMRIDLAPETVSPANTVRRYLQALIARDDDYAKSLMKEPPEILTISNPHPVGYRITDEGTENGNSYVDAEVYWSYTANPYYQVIKSRYYLTAGASGYIIDSIKEDSTIEVYEREGSVYIAQRDDKEEIFKESDIPAEYLEGDSLRLASLAYNPDSDSIVFALQLVDSVKGDAVIRVMSYSRKTKSFQLVNDVKANDGVDDIGATGLTMDSDGNYAALEVYTQSGETFGRNAYAFDLKSGEGKDLSALFTSESAENISTSFWDEGRLVISATIDQQTVKCVYDTETGEMSSF